MKRQYTKLLVFDVTIPPSSSLPSIISQSRVFLAAVLLVLGTISGCVRTLPPGTSFDRPPSLGHMIGKTAWLSRVEMGDPSIEDPEQRDMLEASLTVNLYKFLEEGNYFQDVKLLPGKPAPHDYVLHFRFTRYQQTRSSAIFRTPTDRAELAGTLSIKSPDDQTVTQVRSEIFEEHGVSPWSPEQIFPSGMKARTNLVLDLLRKALFSTEAQTGG